jgi:biotin carboxyl carrier protein
VSRIAAKVARIRPREIPPDSMGESLGLPVRLVVSPAGGRLRLMPPAQFHDGHEWVLAGQALAVVESGQATHEVRATRAARIAGVLVRDGEPVAPGQPLVWLDETVRPPRELTEDAGGEDG